MTKTNTAPAGAHILIHTDGSCLGNPGPGGYAAVLRRIEADGTVGRHKPFVGGNADTTNQRMELEGVIAGLALLKKSAAEGGLPVHVVCDSAYVVNGITQWVHGWQENGWRNSQRKAVANEDLWRKLVLLVSRQNVTWQWTKGHVGTEWNEEVDSLARQSAEQIKRAIEQNPAMFAAAAQREAERQGQAKAA